MKTQNLRSIVSKGLVCAVVAFCFTLTVQASPISTTLKADTGKMEKMGKMDKMSKMKKADKMSKMKKMDKMSKMKKDTSKM